MSASLKLAYMAAVNELEAGIRDRKKGADSSAAHLLIAVGLAERLADDVPAFATLAFLAHEQLRELSRMSGDVPSTVLHAAKALAFARKLDGGDTASFVVPSSLPAV